MTNKPDEFDDFFQDEEFDLDQPSFGQDDFDEDLVGDEQEGGVSRSFVVIAALLAVVFVVLVAVGAAIFLARSGEECDEICIQATQISGTNFAIETSVSASQTAITTQSTATREAEIALQATQTQSAAEQATATRNAENTLVAATATQQSIDATATQAAEFVRQTQVVLSSTPPTAVPSDIQGELQVVGGSGAGVTICIFRDDGDGAFDPADNTSVDCSPTALGAAAPSPAVGGGGAGVEPSATPAQPQPTVTAEATEEAPPSVGATPTRPLNPIFQTATAAAAGSSGGQPAAPSQTEESAPAEPPTPTPESLESGFDPNLYAEPVGRSIADPDPSGLPQQEGGDTFEGEVITDANGRFIIRNLPPGTYWIKVADQTLEIEVTTNPQVLVIPREDAAPIVIEIEGVGPVITPTEISPIFQTATAVAAAGLPRTPTPEGLGPTSTALPVTGLFSGEGDDVTGTDLLILAAIGMVLVGVVFAARKMRSASA